MRYWDNDKDRQFDEALDEMMKEERATIAHLEEAQWNANIGNPMKVMGAI